MKGEKGMDGAIGQIGKTMRDVSFTHTSYKF